MKKIFLLLTFSLFFCGLFAQTSPLDPVCTFNYQAVARDADDNVMADNTMTVRFTILDGPGGNELYIEEHTTTTSSLGLFNLEVGAGDMVGGSMIFDAIPWIIRKHYLKVELDLDGSGSFIVAGEAPVLAVPIAIQAKTASFATINLDTIKRIDTLRVDTINVKKIFATAICVDSIIGRVVIDSIVTEHICLEGDLEIKEGDLKIKDGDIEIMDGDLVMKDKDGNVIFSVDSTGESYHGGLEKFAKGLSVLSDDESSTIFFVKPGDGMYLDGDVEIFDGKFEMLDDEGNLIFAVDENGNSFHAGLETFAGGIEVLNAFGDPILTIDPLADILSGYAFLFGGNVMINGLLQAEVKNFLIDHPLNPDEMTLRHYSVESDQMGTVYNGTVAFDKNGDAIVELPTWFEALNTDFSYQLTCIGGYANVYISEEVKDNKFKISGGKKGLKVSWQINGVRHDPVSSKHKKPIEEYKIKRLE